MQESTENDTGLVVLNKLERSIEFDNVSYRYPLAKSDALKNINIKIKANEMIALVGPSGSGKSTLIDLLPRLRQPKEGFIKIDGVNIEKNTLKSIRELIAYVPQSPQIFNGTVEAHIRYGKGDATDEEVQKSAHLAGAKEFIDQLSEGFDTVLGEDAIRLSGGQRQRLDLARALVKKVPILILDEPTSNLDVESEERLKSVLEKIRNDTDITIIIVTHRLASVVDFDKIIVLNKGLVESVGGHSKLLKERGWYGNAWRDQEADK
ncbi:ATP-binding cassette domain-containing protein [Candidatus Woesearchaeota archaeon]|nr:ATP-binding cassette domain-containing protein [Candidatus Woesearchaeota archaeon]